VAAENRKTLIFRYFSCFFGILLCGKQVGFSYGKNMEKRETVFVSLKHLAESILKFTKFN